MNKFEFFVNLNLFRRGIENCGKYLLHYVKMALTFVSAVHNGNSSIKYIYLLLLLPLGQQPAVGFGLSQNIIPFFPICHQLSPSSHSYHLKISFYFLFPSSPGSFPSSRPFQFLSEDLLGILSSSILSRWPNQLILCLFIHFSMFYPLLISSSSRFGLLFHSPFSYLGPYIHLNIFLSKISGACSFLVIVHASAPYDTSGNIYIYIFTALPLTAIHKPPLIPKLRASIPTPWSQSAVQLMVIFYEQFTDIELWEGFSFNGPV